ncbi:MAG TPA: class I SAM-dependent methyltransferase [Solirubrobacteraceae bacterium]|jgi:SAM-dependent methyltransferase|nr:class I SAM-dependent methyltransferase [Solirubrobacteraceae bacterium]
MPVTAPPAAYTLAAEKRARLLGAAQALERIEADPDYPLPAEHSVVMAEQASFKAIGTEFLAHFIDFGGLRPEHAVLDIGCGGGRMAAALLYYLAAGSYVGFDVHKPSIEWCRKAIAPRHQRFDFQFVDLDNPIYNPSKLSASEFAFPYAENSFDFAIATSLFTHMFMGEVANYLRQAFRVLRPGGALFCTAFLLTPSSVAEMLRNRGAVKFTAEHQGSLINVPERPAAAVAHFAEPLLAQATLAGFVPERQLAGLWPGSGAGVTKQDILVLRKVDRLAAGPVV